MKKELNDTYILHIAKLNSIKNWKLNCVLLNSVQIFIEMQAWLFLTFFLCLRDQLSSFNSIIVQTSEERDLSNSE